jgi:hypothetical protein
VPGNRVLVCEVNTNRIAEYDMQGKLVWSHPCPDPAYAQRLPNGNTFIASHNRSFEVTRDGKEVYGHNAEGGFFIHSTHRKPNGNIVTEESPIAKVGDRYPVFKLPVLRGLGTLGHAMWLGMKALRFSPRDLP